jgi:hypothetical protein
MATVNKHLADELVARNGYYPGGDPRVMRIVEYTNFAGGLSYGLEYEHEVGKYAESQYVRNPKVYWEASGS